MVDVDDDRVKDGLKRAQDVVLSRIKIGRAQPMDLANMLAALSTSTSTKIFADSDVVIEADNVTKAYGDKLLVEKMTFALPPGGIVGVVGPNGAGKTTLFRMITKQEEPDSGTIRIGETVQVAYVDQSRTLDGDKSIWQEISGGEDALKLGNREVNSRAYVGRFNFSGSDQQKKVSMLSGGERNRVDA